MSFGGVYHRRLKYFLSPQLDLYKNINRKFPDAEIVLDYGCGHGFGTLQLSPHKRVVYGVDSDEEALSCAHELVGDFIRLKKEDWTKAKWNSRFKITRLDLVTCIEVIEHVEDPTGIMEAISAFILPKGVAIFSTPNPQADYRKNDFHKVGYGPIGFRALLKKHFRQVTLHDYTLEETIGEDSTRTPIVAICRHE